MLKQGFLSLMRLGFWMLIVLAVMTIPLPVVSLYQHDFCTDVCPIAACPYDAIAVTMQCIARISESDGKGGMLTWTFNRTHRACRKGVFQSAVRCVENIEHSCRHNPHKLRELRKYVDVDKMRTAFKELCKELPYIERYETCLHNQLADVRLCIHQRVKRLRKTLAYSSSEHKIDRLQITCKFVITKDTAMIH